DAGYTVGETPPTSRALLDGLASGGHDTTLAIDVYGRMLARLPASVAERIDAAWGSPANDPDARDGAFRFRAHAFGNILVALAPDRGRTQERRADYHDPALPPRHALLAFGLWL